MTGRVRARSETCDWSFQSGSFADSFTSFWGSTDIYRSHREALPVVRMGFNVEPGCGFSGSSFLPFRLLMDERTPAVPRIGRRVPARSKQRGTMTSDQVQSSPTISLRSIVPSKPQFRDARAHRVDFLAEREAPGWWLAVR